jgi:hypothetical protein
MTFLFLFLGCGPRWSEEGAIRPVFDRVDTDGDGRVSQKEYDALRFGSPGFKELDTSGDQAISPTELLAGILAKDPVSMSPNRPSGADAERKKPRRSGRDDGDGKAPGKAPPRGEGKAEGKAPGAARPGARPGGGKVEDRPADPRQLRAEATQSVRMVLLSLKAEIRSVDPNHAVPTDEEIKTAAASADLRTAESRRVLAGLERAASEVGLPFPAALSEAELAKEPLIPALPPAEEPPSSPKVHLGRDGHPLPPGVAEPPRIAPDDAAPTGPRTPAGTP